MSYVGSFRMRELFPLGKGGMGTTYLACTMGAAAFERLVVVKRLHDRFADDPIQRRRLIEEAELAACVHHAHVVSVVHAGQDARGVFLVLDYIEGSTLSQLRRQLMPERIPTPVAIRIVLDCLGGLAAIHGAKDHRGTPLRIVHRDITPENVLIGLDGSTRVTDFGIAKGVHSAVHTEPSRLLGKTSYLAPEYIATGDFGPLADIYAVGVTLWTTLVGANPWQGLEEAQVLVRAMTTDLPDPPPDAGVSPALLPVLRRACARDPKARYQTASEFARALEAAVGPHQIADDAQVADLMQRVFQERSEKIRAAAANVLSTPSVPPPPMNPPAASAENPTTPAGIVKPASLLPPASPLPQSGVFGSGVQSSPSSSSSDRPTQAHAEAASEMATRPYPEDLKRLLGALGATTSGSHSSAGARAAAGMHATGTPLVADPSSGTPSTGRHRTDEEKMVLSAPHAAPPEPNVEELGTDARGGTTVDRVQREIAGKSRSWKPLLFGGAAALALATAMSAAVLEMRAWAEPRVASSPSLEQGPPALTQRADTGPDTIPTSAGAYGSHDVVTPASHVDAPTSLGSAARSPAPRAADAFVPSAAATSHDTQPTSASLAVQESDPSAAPAEPTTAPVEPTAAQPAASQPAPVAASTTSSTARLASPSSGLVKRNPYRK